MKTLCKISNKLASNFLSLLISGNFKLIANHLFSKRLILIDFRIGNKLLIVKLQTNANLLFLFYLVQKRTLQYTLIARDIFTEIEEFLVKE